VQARSLRASLIIVRDSVSVRPPPMKTLGRLTVELEELACATIQRAPAEVREELVDGLPR